MTPDFVLSLFFEGIRLHRRTAEGWELVGEVPLDSPDLARDLHALRDAGIATGTPWTGTRLLLPPEQVRVLDLEGERDLAGVRAALDGVTPYAVDDLVLDWEMRDGRTHVAAVARETLDEAEAFAAEHGFLPVSFAAPLAGFPREADFGPTRLAATLPGAEASVVPETPSEGAPVPDATEEPAPAEPVSANAALVAAEPAEPAAQEADAIAASEATRPATDPAVVGEPGPPEPAPLEQAAAEPSGATPAALQPQAPGAEAEPIPPGEPAPATASPAADRPTQPGPAPLSAPGAPEPIFASRARPLRAERRDGARLSAASEAVRKAEGRRVEPSVRKPSMPPVAQGWALSAATAAARPDPRMPPRPVGATPHPPVNPAPEPAAIAAVVAEARRPAPLAAPQHVPRPAVLAAAASEPEPERRAAFGRRTEAPARPRGKPRFLGLILTVLLLIVMAAVFAWASTTEQGLAGLFRRTEAPATVAAAPPPEDRAAPSAVAPEAIAAAPSPEPEASPEPAPADVASVAPVAPPVPDAEDAAAAAAAVAAALADLPRAAEPPPALETPAGADPADPLATAAVAPAPEGEDTAVPPAEADRFYAATGVWLRAPRLALLPDADPSAVQIPTVQPLPAAQAPAEPTLLAAAAPDSRPDVQADPATPTEAPAVADAGPALAPDAAAPDARVAFGPPAPPTPPGPSEEAAWVNAMAEPPEVLPPDRPEPPEGFAVATAETQGPPAATVAPSAGEWVNAMAEPPDALPPERPDAPADFLQALAAQPAAPVQPGALAFAATPDAPAPGGVALAGLRPSPRPEGLAPPGGEPPPTILASFDGPRPGPRPEGLAPEPEVESPDVSAALAEALTAPEAPAAPDVQSTLAAIVEGAPDPLAGATPRAVAVARVPDARPRNFGQVVQRQLDRVARASQAPAAGGVGTGDLTAQEQAEAAGEAEAASSAAAAPSGVTPTTVAQAATFADAMRLREVNLIGVYGQPNARRALIRLANGRYVRVGVGDQFDGGQVTAIGDNALNYSRRGRTFQLVIPGG